MPDIRHCPQHFEVCYLLESFASLTIVKYPWCVNLVGNNSNRSDETAATGEILWFALGYTALGG